MTLSPISIPVRERNWIDIDPAPFNEGCSAVSKLVIRLLRHERSIPREKAGAVRFEDLIEKFKVEFAGTLGWTVDAWVSFLAKGGGEKKRFQYWLDPYSSNQFLYFQAIQGHSGGNIVDPLLQDSALLPDDLTEYIYHIGNAHEMHSIIKSGLIPGGRSLRMDRQSVFFTAVNTMCARKDLEEVQYDLDKPRIAGVQEYLEMVCMKIGEELYSKVYQSPSLPRARIWFSRTS